MPGNGSAMIKQSEDFGGGSIAKHPDGVEPMMVKIHKRIIGNITRQGIVLQLFGLFYGRSVENISPNWRWYYSSRGTGRIQI